ncbi:MAG: glycosyltransferase family 39 protein [Candidatus Omnitrophota bacterium]
MNVFRRITSGKDQAIVTWAVVLIIVLASFAIRIRLADVPLQRDEGEYAYHGQLLLQGIPPYVKAYSMKMPGIFVVYALIMAVFGQTNAGIHMGLAVVNAATIIIVFLLGRRLFDREIGIAASAFFAVLSLSQGLQGVSANAEHFAILPILCGLLILSKNNSGKPYRYLLSGTLFGTAVLIKQHSALFVVSAAALIAFYEWRHRTEEGRRGVLRSLLFIAGSAAPLLLTIAWLVAAGAFEKFKFWTFDYARLYVSAYPFLIKVFKNELYMATHLSSPIWIFAVIGIAAPFWDKSLRRNGALVAYFFIFSFLAACPGFYFRLHYFTYLVPAASLSAGVAVGSIARKISERNSKLLKRRTIVALTSFALAVTIFNQRHFFFGMTPKEACRAMYFMNPFPESIKVAEYLRKNASDGDTVAVIGSEPQIYFYSKMRSATAHIYMYPLMEEHKLAVSMQQEMIDQIESKRPEFLVLVNVDASFLMGPKSARMLFDWFDRYKRGYDLVGIADCISHSKTVYRWDEEVVGYYPVSTHRIELYRLKKGEANARNDAVSLNYRGVREGVSGSIDAAIALFDEAITVDSSYAESYNNLGFAYFQKGDLVSAESNFRKTLEIDPGHKKARANLDHILRSKGGK